MFQCDIVFAFSDAINAKSFKLCMATISLELYTLISVPYTLILSSTGHYFGLYQRREETRWIMTSKTLPSPISALFGTSQSEAATQTQNSSAHVRQCFRDVQMSVLDKRDYKWTEKPMWVYCSLPVLSTGLVVLLPLGSPLKRQLVHLSSKISKRVTKLPATASHIQGI